jgi:hypothetical protein
LALNIYVFKLVLQIIAIFFIRILNVCTLLFMCSQTPIEMS